MPDQNDEAAWKSQYIALLDKPNSTDVRLAEAIALKIRKVPPFLYRYRPFNKHAKSELWRGISGYRPQTHLTIHSILPCLFQKKVLIQRLLKEHPEKLFTTPKMVKLFSADERGKVLASNDPFEAAWKMAEEKSGAETRFPWEVIRKMMFDSLRATTASDRASRDEFLRSSIRICCFCENLSSVLMWSHYADKHTGICLEYSSKTLFENNRILPILHPVVYNPERFDLTEHFGAKDPTKTNIFALSLSSCHKAPEWSYESEWRLVVQMNPTSDNSRFSTGIRPSRILVGAKVKPEDLAEIQVLASQIAVPISLARFPKRLLTSIFLKRSLPKPK